MTETPRVPDEDPATHFPPWPDDLTPEDLIRAAQDALRKVDPENNDTP